MPTQERLKELFVYDGERGLLLRKECWVCGSHNVPVYGIHGEGYLVTNVDNNARLMHRLVWVFFNGEIPSTREIDHIDGNRTNNHIENLRLVTRATNTKNAAKRSDNTSGFVGVTWNKSVNKWQSQIQVAGKNIVIGLFADKKHAVKARKDAEVIHGFHKNHGRERASV